jgi:hypothetical protein
MANFARMPAAFLTAGTVALIGCHSSTTSQPLPSVTNDAGAAYDAGPPYVPTFHPIDSDGHVLRDATGRTVILRGYNVKFAGLFDVTPDDGEPPREVIPPLDATDFTMMQASGVNVLRLPVSWSAYEPERGVFDDGYLAQIDAFLALVQPWGFYVLLDFHEDGWSKDLCEDGAPAWATVVPAGVDWEAGAPGGDCHASDPALAAHSSFFDSDTNGMQEDFAAMFEKFAAHFVSNQTVFAYEIFNEPISSDPNVDAFSIKLATAIRQVDPGHLILWEPSALRNQLNQSLQSSTPFPVAGGVYAVHVYTSRQSTEWPYLLQRSIQGARTEADSWGEPLFVTEHGADPDDGGVAWVDEAMTNFDQALASSMDWIWNPGVVTCDAGGGSARDLVFGGQVLAHLTRPYAMAVGGDVTATTWDGATLTVGFTGHPGVPATHDVFWNHGAPAITCDGAAVSAPAADPARNVFTVACGGPGAHTLVFASAP